MVDHILVRDGFKSEKRFLRRLILLVVPLARLRIRHERKMESSAERRVMIGRTSKQRGLLLGVFCLLGCFVVRFTAATIVESSTTQQTMISPGAIGPESIEDIWQGIRSLTTSIVDNRGEATKASSLVREIFSSQKAFDAAPSQFIQRRGLKRNAGKSAKATKRGKRVKETKRSKRSNDPRHPRGKRTRRKRVGEDSGSNDDSRSGRVRADHRKKYRPGKETEKDVSHTQSSPSRPDVTSGHEDSPTLDESTATQPGTPESDIDVLLGELVKDDFMSMDTDPPTGAPTRRPTDLEPQNPTQTPVIEPTTLRPTVGPTRDPTLAPVIEPATDFPTNSPTRLSTLNPSQDPTRAPAIEPTTDFPSTSPTLAPAIQPMTDFPTASPSLELTPLPTDPPTSLPTQTMVCNPPITEQQRQEQILNILVQVSPPSVIEMPGTSQNDAFRWLIDEDPAQVCPEDELDVVQRYIMAVVYYSLGGDTWAECNAASSPTPAPCSDAARYLSGANVCRWFGVTCNAASNTVILGIILEENNLRGLLPNELSALEGLENIDFDQNMGIQGTIPTSLGTLDSLKNLDLNTNDLMGPLPAELCDATMLERIDVLSNSLEGMISNCIGELESLDVLSLDINMFSGTLPTTVGQMSSLQFLTLNNNDFTGPIPDELGSASNLIAISAQQNNFDGTIPATLGGLSRLETLNFFDNDMTGAIPSQLGNLVNLENLFLHFNDFTGIMPAEICLLRSTGNLVQLTADCGASGKVVCPQPDCCTACF